MGTTIVFVVVQIFGSLAVGIKIVRLAGTNTTEASSKGGGMTYQSASTGPDYGALYAGKHSLGKVVLLLVAGMEMPVIA